MAPCPRLFLVGVCPCLVFRVWGVLGVGFGVRAPLAGGVVYWCWRACPVGGRVFVGVWVFWCPVWVCGVCAGVGGRVGAFLWWAGVLGVWAGRCAGDRASVVWRSWVLSRARVCVGAGF